MTVNSSQQRAANRHKCKAEIIKSMKCVKHFKQWDEDYVTKFWQSFVTHVYLFIDCQNVT